MSLRSATEHYAAHLARFYAWSVGGHEAAFERGRSEVDALDLGDPGRALDLGAGFGTHAIPLLERGWAVVAADTSALLLDQLREQAGSSTQLETRQEDLLGAVAAQEDYDLVLCMGDTLTHLASEAEVDALLRSAAARLVPGGRLVLSFRDYSTGDPGARAFIPVRSDETRIHTCIVETGADRVLVHDLLHERGDAQWRLTVSSYPKLRLEPAAVARRMEGHGLVAAAHVTGAGMVMLVGRA